MLKLTMISQMHVISFLALALATMSPALVSAGDVAVSCETSGASPWTEDITGVINQIKGKSDSDSSCSNKNAFGSKCTTVATHYSAGIAVCKSRDDITCAEVADAINQIQQQCKDEVEGHVRAGGSAKIGGVSIEIFQESIDGKLMNIPWIFTVLILMFLIRLVMMHHTGRYYSSSVLNLILFSFFQLQVA